MIIASGGKGRGVRVAKRKQIVPWSQLAHEQRLFDSSVRIRPRRYFRLSRKGFLPGAVQLEESGTFAQHCSKGTSHLPTSYGTAAVKASALEPAYRRGDSGGHFGNYFACTLDVIGYRPAADLALPARPVADELLRLDTPQGQQLLFQSEARTAFLPLVAVLRDTKNQTYCGVASVVMVLNALELPAPTADEHGTYRIFTQRNILNGRTDDMVTSAGSRGEGCSWPKSRSAGGLRREGRASPGRIVQRRAFREMAVRYLNEPGHHVIVNYSRAALGQEGTGHIFSFGRI